VTATIVHAQNGTVEGMGGSGISIDAETKAGNTARDRGELNIDEPPGNEAWGVSTSQLSSGSSLVDLTQCQYDQTHCEVANSEDDTGVGDDYRSGGICVTINSPTSSRRRSEKVATEVELPVPVREGCGDGKRDDIDHQPDLLAVQVVEFVSGHPELYEACLLFKPLNLPALQQRLLAEGGLRVSKQALKAVLAERGVDITDAQTPGN